MKVAYHILHHDARKYVGVELTAFFFEDYTEFEGFTQLKGANDGIIAIMQGITTESISPEKIDLFFKYLRSF